MSALVETTTKVSVVVQVFTGAIGALGLNYTLPPEHSVLTQLLSLEMFVQFIELVFYISFLYAFNLENLATERYFDWMISTPIMLFTMSVYFFYLTAQDQQKKEKITLQDFVNLHKREIFTIVIANFFMLLFGFLGEIGYLPKLTAFFLGTGAFGFSFYTLYNSFAKFSEKARNLFSILFVLWSGYGVGFLFPTVTKNILFNGLDILAKNFFGLFLYFQIVNVANKEKIDAQKSG